MDSSDRLRPLRLRVTGERACFSRPEMKTERVSYDVMTPSAARGVLEAVLWKPEMRWVVERIDILHPIAWESIRRNEVGQRISLHNLMAVMNGGSATTGIDITDARQQRGALVLRNVDYIIHARIELTPRASPGTTLAKYVDMFRRRAAKGQCFHRPYLGTREFAADFSLPDDDETPLPLAIDLDLGWMLLDIDHAGERPVPLFFRARLDQGCLRVPHPGSDEVRR